MRCNKTVFTSLLTHWRRRTNGRQCHAAAAACAQGGPSDTDSLCCEQMGGNTGLISEQHAPTMVLHPAPPPNPRAHPCTFVPQAPPCTEHVITRTSAEQRQNLARGAALPGVRKPKVSGVDLPTSDPPGRAADSLWLATHHPWAGNHAVPGTPRYRSLVNVLAGAGVQHLHRGQAGDGRASKGVLNSTPESRSGAFHRCRGSHTGLPLHQAKIKTPDTKEQQSCA